MKYPKVHTIGLLVVIASSCGIKTPVSSTADTLAFNKKQFRHSRTISTYSGGANEFEDGYLELKENGYFKFYIKFWMLVTIKESGYIGRYSQKGNFIYLNWGSINPQNIKPYLSNTCMVDSLGKHITFINGGNTSSWIMSKK